MERVALDQLVLPDWGWHSDDREEAAKLTASLVKFGLLHALLVRTRADGKLEVVDGRRRLHVMRQMAERFETVWCHNLGALTQEEALKLALTLELSAEVNYPRLATCVKALQDTSDFQSLSTITPYSYDRLRYFIQLTEFDWAQYASQEQGSLYEDEDAPAARAAPALVATLPAAPAQPRQRAATAQNDSAARLAARAAFSSHTAAIIPFPPQVEIAVESLQIDAVQPRDVQSTILMGDDNSVPDIVQGFVPDEPPCLDGITEIELDTETTGLKWWAGDRPIGIAVRLPDGTRKYLPWAHTGGNLDESAVKRWAQRELRDKKILNANTRFDVHMLHAWGVDLEAQGCTFADVQHYAALLDEYRKEFSLDALAKDYLGQHKTGEGLDKSRMATYHASQVAPYAQQDVHLVGELRQVLLPQIAAQDLQAVVQLESDIIPVVCEMERNGAYVNREKLRAFVHDSANMLEELLFEVSRECGFQVNPDKNADLTKLFDFLKLPYPGRTDPSTRFPNGQPSFADALLGKVDHPLVQMVRRSGKLSSLRSKFLVPYSQVIGEDNTLRFALHQLRGDEYGTVRGRFSMSGSSKGTGAFGANLQQVFRVNSQRMAFGFAHDDSSHDHEIFLVRSLFEAAPGASYLSADAQAIEYRLAAHYAQQEDLIEAYQADVQQLAEGRLTDKWVDFHRVVGDVIRPHKDLSRNIVKNANFCLVYGGGKPTLADTLGLPRAEATQIYDVWHRMFPGLSKLPKKTETLARDKGFVKTILGRRARFSTPEQLMFAHAAINYVIQGSAADIMKTKLVELHKHRAYTGLLMRQTVHDEVDGDATLPETAARVREILNRQSFRLRVPIVWEVETGENWSVAH